METSTLTGLVFNLNHILDRGYYEFSIEEIKEKIRDRSLFEYLDEKISKDDYFDISMLDVNDRSWLLDGFQDMADNIDADRKLAVQKSGICLLLAYVIELIQRQRHNT